MLVNNFSQFVSLTVTVNLETLVSIRILSKILQSTIYFIDSENK